MLITLHLFIKQELKRAEEEKEAKEEASDYGNKKRREGSEERSSDY